VARKSNGRRDFRGEQLSLHLSLKNLANQFSLTQFAYKPLDTPLLRQMRRFRSETGRPWILVGGLELVSEQAVAQFELLTGRKAPRRLMTLEALQNYVGENGSLDEKEIQARLGYT
jgi:shikimate 5-dehydrogenase